MNYISKEQLDIEIQSPIVTDIKQNSIQKFIDSYNAVQFKKQLKRQELRPVRPITTKAFINEHTYFQT